MSETFTATLFRDPREGAWTFVVVPPEHQPPATHAFGRTPVMATIDGRVFKTSVWRDKVHGALLPVKAKARRGKQPGDRVEVSLAPVEP